MENKSMPLIPLKVDDKTIYMPYVEARNMLLSVIPLWMRDSTVDPPKPENENVKIGQKALIGIRSGLKALARPFVPQLFEALYRRPIKMGRADCLPIFATILVDFVLIQILAYPLEITTDGETGLIQNIRPIKQPAIEDNAALSGDRELQRAQSNGANSSATEAC